MRTFRDWLMSKRFRDGPKIDFQADAASDPGFPLDVRDWGRLRGYLSDCNACEGAVDAARLLWRDYRRDMSRLAQTGA